MSPMGCAWLALAACFGFARAVLPELDKGSAVLRRESQEQATQEVNKGSASLVEEVVHKHSIRLENHASGDVAEEATPNVPACSGSWSIACAQEYLHSADLATVLAKVHEYDALTALLHPAAKASIALAELHQAQQGSSAGAAAILAEQASPPAKTEHDKEIEKEDKEDAKKPPQKRKSTAMAGVLATSIVIILFGYLYQQKVTFKRKAPLPKVDDAEFDGEYRIDDKDIPICCSVFDVHNCLHSCCCIPIRLGDTHQQMQLEVCGPIGPFWSVALIWIFIVNWAVFARRFLPMPFGGKGQGAIHLLMDVLFAWYLAAQRAKIRTALGQTKDTSLLWDLCLYLCCLPCTAYQDAGYIDGAARTSVKCCCDLNVLNKDGEAYKGAVIGDPVAVTGGGADGANPQATAATAATAPKVRESGGDAPEK